MNPLLLDTLRVYRQRQARAPFTGYGWADVLKPGPINRQRRCLQLRMDSLVVNALKPGRQRFVKVRKAGYASCLGFRIKMLLKHIEHPLNLAAPLRGALLAVPLDDLHLRHRGC